MHGNGWDFSNRELDKAVATFERGELLSMAQMAMLRAAADPLFFSKEFKRAPKLSNFNFAPPSKRNSIGWEAFTCADETGRVTMREHTTELPRVTIKGDILGAYRAAPEQKRSGGGRGAGGSGSGGSDKLRPSASGPPTRTGVTIPEDAAADVLGVTSQDGRGTEALASSTPLAATARSVSLPKLTPGGGGAAIVSVRTDTSKLKRSKAAEARAWKELAGMRQAVQKARAQAAQRDLHERRAAGRVAYETHAFGDRVTCPSVAAASAAEVGELSEQFNTQIAFIELDPAKRSWYKLFKFMDSDGSGRVTYEEVREMVRSEAGGLRLGEDKLPEARLQSLWRALDEDASGYITVKEFGLFMKQGETAASGPGWKEKRTAFNRAEAEEMTKKINQERSAMAGVQPASKEELRELAMSFNQQMTVLLGSASWYKLFSGMDQDKSGRVTYIEFRGMVRSEASGLALQPAQLPEPRLRSLWRALDEDASGYITVKEFGLFMKQGETAASGPGWKEKRTAFNRAEAEEMTKKINQERSAMAGVQPASKEEVRELAVSFNQNMQVLLVGTAGGDATASWYKLFIGMDQDKSGRVTYVELKGMVRSETGGLGLRPAQLPESKLRSLWRALDDDGSGFITAKEFGSFMRAGTATSGPGGWRERLTAHNRSEAEEMTRKLNEERNAMAGVQPASKDEVGELACKMHACMLENKQKNW